MWDHESQRIGKQRCNPKGYQLHGISDVVGILSLLALFAFFPLKIALSKFLPSLEISNYFMFLPFITAIIGNILHSHSWKMLEDKDFHYDPENSVVTWVENNEKVTYKYGTEDENSDI